MEFKMKNLKPFFLGGAILIFFAWALNNLGLLKSGLFSLMEMLGPFLIGAAFAFILNVPMRAMERLLLKRVKRKKFARALSMVLSLVIVALILAFVFMMVIPEIIETIAQINRGIPGFIREVGQWIEGLTDNVPELGDYLTSLQNDWSNLNKNLLDVLQNTVTNVLVSTVGVATSMIDAIVTLVIAVIFAMYILAQKEKLASQGKRVMYAYLPQKRVDRILEILRLSSRIFSGFIAGQCTEAVVFGCFCFLGMTIFRLPYALTISVLIGFTTLIPIFGAIIGTVVGALLIMVASPIKAVIFVIMILVFQQIDGNLIYPRIVGNSVGLPGIWVMMAVTVGGSLLGVFGMLVFVPLASVAYCLIRENVGKRLKLRNMDGRAAGL